MAFHTYGNFDKMPCMLNQLKSAIPHATNPDRCGASNFTPSQVDTKSSISVPTHQHVFSMETGKTALLVVDMQNDFCHPDGFCCSELGVDITAVREIIPRIQKVIDYARREGILVVYTMESHPPSLSDLTPSKRLRYENGRCPIGALGKMGGYLLQGQKGAKIISELQPLESEIQLDKPQHSAFASTNLDAILKELGVTHLLITGVTTECCVLGTYRQANDLGFHCLLLEDCCAAFEESHHQAAITIILAEDGVIGWVTSSEKLFEALVD